MANPTGKGGFKPGQSGNPSGKPRLPEELKRISALTKDHVSRLISKYGSMTKEELSAAIASANIPMIELTIASIYAQAAKGGDFTRMAFLLDRTVGKVENEIVLRQRLEEKARAMTDAELIEAAEKALLEAKKDA